jgi:alanine dehydrogenase
MKIGIAKEIKKHEYRVGATPECAHAYAVAGHEVHVEKNAGMGAGYTDDEYVKAGATIETNKKALFDWAEMIVKVKEPLPDEFALFHEGQILYTYLHLASDASLTRELMKTKIIGVAYETIELADRSLPCLIPMSEIAGRLAPQEAAKYLEKSFGGRGVLLGGVPGVSRGKVTILGGGIVGRNAAKIAIGLGADVTILDIASRRLAYLDDIFGSSAKTLYSNDANIESCLAESDVVIGAVLLTGASAPKLITREHLKLMKKGAVIVDVAVDQGGCAETTRPTTHDDPIYIVEDVVHYCVANMPGVVALTSTLALTNQTLPFGLMIANQGIEAAVDENRPVELGVNLWKGHLVYEAVATSLDLPYTPLQKARA